MGLAGTNISEATLKKRVTWFPLKGEGKVLSKRRRRRRRKAGSSKKEMEELEVFMSSGFQLLLYFGSSGVGFGEERRTCYVSVKAPS